MINILYYYSMTKLMNKKKFSDYDYTGDTLVVNHRFSRITLKKYIFYVSKVLVTF